MLRALPPLKTPQVCQEFYNCYKYYEGKRGTSITIFTTKKCNSLSASNYNPYFLHQIEYNFQRLLFKIKSKNPFFEKKRLGEGFFSNPPVIIFWTFHFSLFESFLKYIWLYKSFIHFLSTFKQSGSGCSTAVECKPHNREVVGLLPTGCWSFFSFYPL